MRGDCVGDKKEDFPEMKFSLEKTTVVAKSRRIRARWGISDIEQFQIDLEEYLEIYHHTNDPQDIISHAETLLVEKHMQDLYIFDRLSIKPEFDDKTKQWRVTITLKRRKHIVTMVIKD